MKTHKQWLKDVRDMNRSVTAHSGAIAPIWTIRFAGEAHQAGNISLEERDKILADARCTLGMCNDALHLTEERKVSDETE